MNEIEPKEFDPRDRNKDGKVSVAERLMDAAGKAGEAFLEVADATLDGAKMVVGKVKDYAELSPEERQVKNEEIRMKASNAADKAVDAAKGAFNDVKAASERFFNKPEAKEQQ